jgi:hypothetical protein
MIFDFLNAIIIEKIDHYNGLLKDYRERFIFNTKKT